MFAPLDACIDRLNYNHHQYLQQRCLQNNTDGSLSPCPFHQDGSQPCLCPLSTAVDKESYPNQDMITGNSLSISENGSPSPLPNGYSYPSPTWNPPARRLLWPTAGKSLPGSKAPSLNLAMFPLTDLIPPTGKKSGIMRFLELYSKSQQTFVLDVILPSEEYPLTSVFQSLFPDVRLSIMDLLEQESPDVLGTRPGWTPTLRIREQSSGVVIKVSDVLLLMNFVVEWMQLTSFDGSTVIQLLWSLKAPQQS